MKLSFTIALALSAIGIIPSGPAYFKQVTPRDSILIADQIEYGFELKDVSEGTAIALPDMQGYSNDTLMLVRGWQLDTLKYQKKKGLADIRGTVILAPFEPGNYNMDTLPVGIATAPGAIDTLLFEPVRFEVVTIPVDTATFEINDIKGQIKYPVTFREVLPYSLGFLAFAALVAVAIALMKRARARKQEAESKEPAYIVALRQLENYRGDRYWAPEKQKAFYSGITDALKFYIEDRFGVDAPEMTTAELFDALKSDKDITPELFAEVKDLFETADFVKFAKFTATQTQTAAALPVAVKFVTTTYQTVLEEEQKKEDVL